LWLCLLLLVAGAGIGHPLFWRYHVKRFQVVHPGVLYRVGQPTEFGVRYLVEQEHVRTVLSLQLDDRRLKPGGPRESEFTRSLGAEHQQWPMGLEACWPWVTPWQFEQFFRLFDDPAKLPVAVHCMGGRHRTGTVSALFRLEYDRWPVEKALAEMYDFGFGAPIAHQEIHLRTYLPRPRPDAATFEALRQAFEPVIGNGAKDYDEFVRRLRGSHDRAGAQKAMEAYLAADKPFALPLAQRLIDGLDDPLAPMARAKAIACVENDVATADEWAMAAALIADFGSPEEQARLLAWITEHSHETTVSPHYAAVAAGVMNRYTPNRQIYLRPLLEDQRHCVNPAASRYRYCDVAVARLAAINNEKLIDGPDDPAGWEQARQRGLAWFAAHRDAEKLSQLLPATGNNSVQLTEDALDEDLSRMRR
jgi:hypothetical protein